MLHPSIRLGRIAHIEVGLHWSVLVIMLLFSWSLADATLPDLAPGSSTAAYWVVALVAVVLLFSSLLAHELAHSVVALRRGVAVDGITLWLLGGVSQLHGDAETPDDELRIAAAGPLTSFALAAVFGAAAAAVSAAGGSELAVAALGWLGVINAVLAVFNLIPGAPLDGGRLLHAAVWRRSGDRGYATVVATRAGGRVGYVLIGVGVLLLLLGDLAAAWFVLLGWFLLAASRAEATHALLHGALARVRARDVMSGDPVVVPGDLPVDRLVDEWFLHHDCSAFPVTGPDGRVVGLVTLAQVKAAGRDRWSALSVLDVADPLATLTRCAPDEPLGNVLERMPRTARGGGRILVFDDDVLVGIITPTDVQRAVEVASLRAPQAPSLDTPSEPVASGGSTS
jgi:Zn-dependent protease/CBS domain-containing protein